MEHTHNYAISTYHGCVPHIIDPQFTAPYIIYVDDILYKNSYYSHRPELSLSEFLNLKNKLILKFRDGTKPSRRACTRSLLSKHGKLIITKEEYERLIKIAKPDFYDSFVPDITNKNNIGCIGEPKDISDAINMLEDGKIIGTEFVNVITNEGKIIDNEKIMSVDEYGFSCACCEKYSAEYIKYIWSIKEINAFTILQNHNLNQLEKLSKKYFKSME